jgi:competence protein ComEA
MLTRAESTYLALTLAFLAAGFGLKTWSRSAARVGPFPDAATLAQDSARAADSSAAAEARSPDSSAATAGPGFRPLPPAEDRGALADPEAPARGGARNRPRKDGSDSAGKIDLNRADAAGLMRVKGIGAKTAEAILAYRRAHGPFRDMRDLLQIKGIGEKKLEKLAPHIIL